MPEDGIKLLCHEEILSFDEIIAFSEFTISKGIDKIRITGGEPLVRKGICSLIKSLSKLQGLKELCMTTNGQLLAEMANELKLSGLDRLNISLDTLDPKRYTELTRGGDIRKVFEGIEAAKRVGFGTPSSPIKLNCVVSSETTPEEKNSLKAFAEKESLELRFISLMTLSEGKFSQVEGGNGGDCLHCNRLRLTSTGELKPCLFSDLSYNIRILGFEESLRQALENKPIKGVANHCDSFYNLGG